MMNFCTLFDSYYLLKGLVLYCSLEIVTDDFHLYVMALDRDCYDKLKLCHLPHMTIELLDDFETPELLAVKTSRTKAEYCWTCGPSVIWHFMKKHNLPEITYLDSDLFFMGDPHAIQQEIGKSSVCITEQGIGEEAMKLYGRYCVQYMYFRNDEEGCRTLKWWRDSCIEWCFQRFEDDKYGDQKYLDKFPTLSSSLCVLQNPSAGIAPWNMNNYKLKGNSILKDGKEYPFVFFHMHGITADIKGNHLTMKSLHHKFNKEQIDKFLYPYALLNMEVLNKYFKVKIFKCDAYGIGRVKELEYKLRGIFRKIMPVQWLYYKVIGVTYKGHGQIIE